MPTFKVDYYGSWNGGLCSGESELVLTDSELESLLNLIREHGGDNDVKAIGLAEALPDVYAKFVAAFIDPIALDGSVAWAVDGYLNGYLEEPENFLDKIEEDGVMKFETRKEDCVDCDGEFDEDEWDDLRREEWEEFFGALPKKKQFDILAKYLGDSIYDYDGGYDYDSDGEADDEESWQAGRMYIPKEILDML